MSLIDLLQYTDKLVQGIAAEVISQLSRLSAVRRTLRVSQGIKRLVSITTTSSSSAPLITNVQSNLAKGRIADSSPFPTVNGFVRYWPRLIHDSSDPTWSCPKRHADQSVRFLQCSFFYLNLQNPMLYSAFQYAWQPTKLYFPWAISTRVEYLVSWAYPSRPSNRHLHRFSRFCMAHEHDQQTDRQTDRPRCWHLMQCMRPNNVSASCLSVCDQDRSRLMFQPR